MANDESHDDTKQKVGEDTTSELQTAAEKKQLVNQKQTIWAYRFLLVGDT